MEKDIKNIIVIGKIVAPQGLRGEVRVQTYTENPQDFQKLKVKSSKFKDGDFKFVRVVPSSDLIIAKIAGFDDRNAAESLRGTELYISRDSLPALGADEYYQADLIGMVVLSGGEPVGTVVTMHNFGAGDILELDNGEMLSFVGADVDMEHRAIIL